MSDNHSQPSRSERTARDADTINGFFGTRAGAITTSVLIGGALVLALVGWLIKVLG
ncbi:hypothetical protein [Microbacterium gorillae]|uniref:hypothetical protein n=1 Tax=Microbacterium gorillae TaxID=1231063 RepID=UPI003D96C2F4